MYVQQGVQPVTTVVKAVLPVQPQGEYVPPTEPVTA
jgi:hypothetical protein